jgi:hypothetical protein
MAFTYSSKDQLYFNQSKGVTRAYTCASGTKLLILGFVIATATPRIGSAPTYNGVTMTESGNETEHTITYFLGLQYNLENNENRKILLQIDSEGNFIINN